MYQLDPLGRMTLTSLEISRRAAERHAHTEALNWPHTEKGWRRRRPQEWLRVMVLPAFA